MRENTFDIPAYKFFAMKINDGRVSHTIDDYKFLIDNGFSNNIMLIPFENIDGLEVQLVRGLLKTKDLFLLGTMYYKPINFIKNYDEINQPVNICDIRAVYFDKMDLDKNCQKTVDKLWEEYMEENYISSDDYTKRMYRCFFERYQDGSYEETKKRIKRLEIGK